MPVCKMFKTDKELERKGILAEYGKTRIRIARAGGSNKAYLKRLDKATKPHRKALMAGVMDADQADPIAMQLFAQHIVLGWEENVRGPEDTEDNWKSGIHPSDVGEEGDELLPVSQENVYRAFMYQKDLFNDLSQMANNHTLYLQDIREAAAGN